MAETSKTVEAGSSGGSQSPLLPPPHDEEVFDMNNNDPNNNTEFNEPEIIEESDVEDERAEDIQFKLLTEARAIHGILSHYSINEIYSYLEASIDHPDRMQFVMNGFLTRAATEGDDNVNVSLKGQSSPSATKRRNDVASISEDAPVSKKEKFEDMNVFLNSSGNDDYLDIPYQSPVDENWHIVNSDNENDDDDDVPVVKIPIENEENNSIPAVRINDTIRKEQISQLQELFPKMDSKMLESRYMEIFPIEAENSLNILVAQMLDFQDEGVALEVSASSEHEPSVIHVMQSVANNTVPSAVEISDITSEPNSSRDPTTTINTNTEHSITLDAPSVALNRPNTSKSSVASTSKDASPSNIMEHEKAWDDPDGETISVDPEIQKQMSYLMAVLPNADPTFLQQKCVEFKDKNAEMEAFIADAVENKNYPTLAEYNKREEENKELKQITRRLSAKEFLERYPDPETTFKSKDHKNDPEYIERTMYYLLGRFRNVAKISITNSIKRNNNLTKVVEELTKGVGVSYLKKARAVTREPEHLKNCRHLLFLQEVTYIEKKGELEDYKRQLTEEKERKFKEAKERGELLECGCCFDAECLITDMSACSEGHLFCKECIRRYAENEIGNGKNTFVCIEEGCNEEFPLKVLQGVLTPVMLSRLVQRKQLEEIKAAEIEGLETCPVCKEFATIPDPDDKLFHCLDIDCLKISCRQCKELSHIPLRCDEVEKNEEVLARKMIEDRMTEALVRECWKCHKKFVKLDGCNKMSCVCGAIMCYLCRQPITGYDHFSNDKSSNSNKCQLYVNNDELHVRAVAEEAQKALADLKAKNPSVNLKHDPTKMLPSMQQFQSYPQPQIRNPVPLVLQHVVFRMQQHLGAMPVNNLQRAQNRQRRMQHRTVIHRNITANVNQNERIG